MNTKSGRIYRDIFFQISYFINKEIFTMLNWPKYLAYFPNMDTKFGRWTKEIWTHARAHTHTPPFLSHTHPDG